MPFHKKKNLAPIFSLKYFGKMLNISYKDKFLLSEKNYRMKTGNKFYDYVEEAIILKHLMQNLCC